jgi:transketolase
MIDGPTEEITLLESLNEKFASFGWEALRVDGHDFNALAGAIEKARTVKGKPTVIICDTIKGKCVDYMENDYKWHYGGLDSDMRDKALASIENFYAKA